MRACYAQRRQAIREGRPVKWNCDEFMAATQSPKKLPKYRRKGRKLYEGPKGGLFYLTASGRKVYV